MIVYDLVCKPEKHQFEGWFGSSADFDAQLAGNLLCCPICGTHAVSKAIMAPNIGRKGNQRLAPEVRPAAELPVAVSNQPEMPAEIEKVIAELGALQNRMLENSEWVGRKFSDEARAIHYGESPQRIIHGEASPDEAQALFEEGVSVAPLPLPYVPPEAKN